LYQENQTLYQTLYQNIVSIVSHPSTWADMEERKGFKEKEGKEAAAPTPDYILAYENNIGLITPIIKSSIETAVSSYTSQWVIDAIVEATQSGARSWNYVKAILERWGREGRGKKGTNGSSLTQQEIIAAALAEIGDW